MSLKNMLLMFVAGFVFVAGPAMAQSSSDPIVSWETINGAGAGSPNPPCPRAKPQGGPPRAMYVERVGTTQSGQKVCVWSYAGQRESYWSGFGQCALSDQNYQDCLRYGSGHQGYSRGGDYQAPGSPFWQPTQRPYQYYCDRSGRGCDNAPYRR